MTTRRILWNQREDREEVCVCVGVCVCACVCVGGWGGWVGGGGVLVRNASKVSSTGKQNANALCKKKRKKQNC